MVKRAMGRGLAISLAALTAAQAAAQDQGVSYTFFGTPGLLEMPSSVAPPEGEIALSITGYGPYQRNAFTFQVTDRLSGTFRYGSTDAYTLPGLPAPDADYVYFDRSFDLRYRLFTEGDIRPSVTVGLQDFLGTGQFSAEYIVATKTIGDSFRVTAGLGWGRLASEGGFSNPLSILGETFDERPPLDFGEGGEVEYDQFFRGDAALFGGIEYAYSPDLMFAAEYSSDAHSREAELGLIDVASPLNFGVTYQPREGVHLTAAYLHGNELGLMGTIVFNPNDRPIDGGFDSPPVPVAVREGGAAAALSWDRIAEPEDQVREALRRAMAAEGLTLNALQLDDRSARIRFTNNRYRTEAQALGRAARVLTAVLPASVETFVLEPMSEGIPISAATMSRTDLERFEMVAGGTQAIQERVDLSDAGPSDGLTVIDPEARLSWGIAPYFSYVLFSGGDPVSLDAGLAFSAAYEFSPNLVLQGSIRKSFLDHETSEIDTGSALPPVRTTSPLYRSEGDGGIRSLFLSYHARPGTDLFSRVSVGLLEPAFGGVSAELLYSPVDTAWAVGAEVNYVAQRDFDLGFGFQDYDVVTGHASVYYDFDNGFHGQVDVGRYLAGDWGATFSLDREFENGWRLGGFFTLTDVDPEDFGEGSFDKGLRLSIPLDYFVGTPTQRTYNATLNSLARDGGARLRVQDRLYGTVRDGQAYQLDDGWGRFWR